MNKLKVLKHNFMLSADSSHQDFQSIIAKLRDMIAFVSLPIILSLFLVAILTVRRLKKFAHDQDNLLSNLEQLVLDRTQALTLDRQLLHHLNEAIGITDQSANLIITNKKLSNLFKHNNLEPQANIWHLLTNLFRAINTQDIQEELLINHQWRGEYPLISQPNRFLMIDISMIQDPSLPQSYYAFVLTDISELKKIQSQLEYTATFDMITHLPNRHAFHKKINQLISNPKVKHFHLIYLDLDEFKWINDHLGHSKGDHLLLHVAKVFRMSLPENAYLARIGGDEFAIIIEEKMADYRIFSLTEQLISALKAQSSHITQGHPIGCSLGMATYPEHGSSAEELIKKADYAMYQAKQTGKNRFIAFDLKMDEQLNYLYMIEKNLHAAIKNHEFSVYYQPQYNLNNLKLVVAEALIRWQTPIGMIPPAEFIPLAEQFGMINDIGNFVLQTAIKQLKTWQNKPKSLPRMAINASAIQLLTGNFGQVIEESLHEHDIEPCMIDIEVTETVMMDNIESMGGKTGEKANCLSFLQSKGLEISIDDFGTGYSSLSYIKHLDVDRIKIDKSFIDDLAQNPESRSIVRAIIKMGHSLGLIVLAEGIETPNQLDILKSLDCDEGQGYLFNRPLPPEDFELKCLK